MTFNIPTKESVYELEIKKSKFIAYLFISDNIEDLKTKVSELKKENLKARHVCYAAFFGDNNNPIIRSNDDGEPSGTAGKPILEAIREKGVHNTFIIVVRYFGGIKLGASGLIRAYHSSAIGALESSSLVKDIKKVYKTLSIEYDKYELFKRECNKQNVVISKEEFHEKISIELEFEEGKDPLFPYGMVLID